MKTKKYLILVVVSLVAIVGPAIGTGGIEWPPLPEITDRIVFMEGVFFAQNVTNDWRIALKNELEGIQEVEILVEKLPQEAERYGLTRQAL